MIGLLLVGLAGLTVVLVGMPVVLIGLALETCEQQGNEAAGPGSLPRLA